MHGVRRRAVWRRVPPKSFDKQELKLAVARDRLAILREENDDLLQECSVAKEKATAAEATLKMATTQAIALTNTADRARAETTS